MSDEMEPQSSLDKRAETESGTKPSIGASAKPKLTGSEQPNLTVLELASVEDFAQTKIGSLLQVIDTLDFYAIDSKLRALYLQASAEGNHAAYRAYRVLMIVCSYYFSIDRQDAFGPSRIKPAAQTLMTNFAIDDRHLIAIVSISPFVAPGFKETYALGLARFLQFDMMSACHLLFPQLENSLRHVLSDIGIDTSKLDEEMLQEDRSISGLLKHRREPLEQIFGIDLIYTIDLLFNLKGGRCLRHELAHGKLAPGSCYHASSIYACWLMYYLACLPLLPYWKTHVAPKLELIAL